MTYAQATAKTGRLLAVNPKRGRKSRRWAKFQDESGWPMHDNRMGAWRKARRKASAHSSRRRNPGLKDGRLRKSRHFLESLRSRRVARLEDRWRKRRNPKRDGTATRGEKRQSKYKDHLRAIRERGQKAADELNRLLGRGVHKAASEPMLRAEKTPTQEAHPAHYAPEESSDQKYARQQLANVNALMADLRDQLRDIGDDEALADGISEQLVKLGKQRKALMDVAQPVMSNPRRRSSRRRLHPSGKARYATALKRLRSAVRSLR